MQLLDYNIDRFVHNNSMFCDFSHKIIFKNAKIGSSGYRNIQHLGCYMNKHGECKICIYYYKHNKEYVFKQMVNSDALIEVIDHIVKTEKINNYTVIKLF